MPLTARKDRLSFRKGHVAGGKITSAHTTIIDAACIVVKRANDQPEVTKIVLGIIHNVAGGQSKISFDQITGGFKVTIRGSATIQEFVVYTDRPAVTREALFRAFWIKKK